MALTEPVDVVAHRGFSGRHPEMTRAAYRDAIELARTTGQRVVLECDVQLSADGELVLAHDDTLRRIAGVPAAIPDLEWARLRTLDVGSWKVAHPDADQRGLLRLGDLLDLIAGARAEGVDVELALETKHPNPRGLDLDRRCLAALGERGWLDAGAPVRLISFHPDAVRLFVVEAPALRRTLLIEKSLGEWGDGHLPEGVDTAGVDWRLAVRHPGFVDRLLARGNRLHLWTLNRRPSMAMWLRRGATGVTSDHPDRALDVVTRAGARTR